MRNNPERKRISDHRFLTLTLPFAAPALELHASRYEPRQKTAATTTQGVLIAHS
jgi:hypothetical protein